MDYYLLTEQRPEDALTLTLVPESEKSACAMQFSSGKKRVHSTRGVKASDREKYQNKLWKKAVCKRDIEN